MNSARWMTALVVVLLYAGFCAWMAWRHRAQRRAAEADLQMFSSRSDAEDAWWICHATQTGQAEAYARWTAQAMHRAGLSVKCLPLGQLQKKDLPSIRKLLCVVSTYGEGDPPDGATAFASGVMAAQGLDLAHLQFSVLALGDRSYQHFCGFGRALHQWFQARQARTLFEPVEVDRGDVQALERWRTQLTQTTGVASLAPWSGGDEVPMLSWRLRRREHLNPGSLGEPVYHLEWVPADDETPLPSWEAGDLVQVEVPTAPGAPRDYSIASVPQDGAWHLLVRRARRADGTWGLASGWLTQGLNVGDTLRMRLRPNTGFRIQANAERPLILIGNGTGMAGLRAHLRARLGAAGTHGSAAAPEPFAPAWLLFGERQSHCDALYREEIDHWQRRAGLRVDWVFSREGSALRYVQHALKAQAEQLSDWVARGAAIYVCGSRVGMAGEVDAVLREVLGEAEVDALIAQGRYCRDVY